MSRLTAFVAVALGLIVAHPRVLAQPRPLIVVLDASAQPRVMFGPRNQPVANPEAAMSPVAMPVSKQDARMADGMIISAIAFDGWTEGSLFRVVALAVLHKDGEPAPNPSRMRDLPKRQIASFTLAVGQSRSVDEMKAFGLDPLVVRAELRDPLQESTQKPGPPAAVTAQKRSRDIRFNMRLIDPGYCESVAVADFNNDGKLDVVSGEQWFEAPSWTAHKIRDIGFTSGYVDNFSDLAVDVDGDGYTDVVQIAYFARRIVWLKNPGKSGKPWVESEIESIGPTEFAFLVDLNNDGKALEILPQFTGAANAPLLWYELQDRKWVKHIVSPQSYGHGIGVGDLNGDGRNDILTAKGWLEAPADPRAPGEWMLHATDWGLPAAAEFGFMHVLDVNQDGRRDVITTIAHANGVLWIEQLADGKWMSRTFDNTWSQSHTSALADINGDGRVDLITGKRYHARNAAQDASEREPLGLYWYEFVTNPPPSVSPAAPQPSSVTWIRHIIDYGGRAGTGLQMVAVDIDRDGDLDVITGGKTGVFLAENLATRASAAR
jgi:hypothetical protein